MEPDVPRSYTGDNADVRHLSAGHTIGPLAVRIEVVEEHWPDLNYLGCERDEPVLFTIHTRTGVLTGPDLRMLREGLPTTRRAKLYFEAVGLPSVLENWNHLPGETRDQIIAEHDSLEDADIELACQAYARYVDFLEDRWRPLKLLISVLYRGQYIAEVSLSGV